MKSSVKSLILTISIVIVSITLYYCSNDSSALTTRGNIYVYTAIVPLILIFLFALKKGGIFSSIFNKVLIFSLLFFMILYGFILLILSNLNDTMIYSLSYISNVIPIFILIVGLAIFSKFFTNNIMRMGGVPKFILSFIFFIPCLLNDFLVSFKNELITAPILAYILVVLEISVLFVYYFMKRLMISTSSGDEVIIYKGKYFLDTKEEIILGNMEQLHEKELNDNKTELTNLIANIKPMAYALSLWVQINQTEIIDVDFPILLYGEKSNPKPRICYSNTVKTGSCLNIDLSGINKYSEKAMLNMKIENQKWNHLVFNYNGSIVDVFLNGILHKSINLSGNMPIHNFSDSMKIGSNQQILNGAIADVRYNKIPLTAYQVLAKYRFGINTIDL